MDLAKCLCIKQFKQYYLYKEESRRIENNNRAGYDGGNYAAA